MFVFWMTDAINAKCGNGHIQYDLKKLYYYISMNFDV